MPPEFFRESCDLFPRVLHGSRSVDFVGGVLKFFFVGELERDAVARFFFAEAARAEALDLFFGTAVDNDETVEAFMHAGLNEQRSLDENGVVRILFFPHGKLMVHGRFDERMENGIEFGEFCVVGENDRPEFFAIDGMVGAKNILSKFVDDGFIRGLTALYELMAEGIRVENMKAEFAKLRCNPTFAAGDSPGEAESFHRFIRDANLPGKSRTHKF
jgi:hypothetical protein